MRLLDKVRKHPHKFDLYKLMDILENTKSTQQDKFGQGTRASEPAQIKGAIELYAQPCDVSKLSYKNNTLTLHNNLISLTHNNDMMDSALVEQFFTHNYNANPMVDFLDIFNHKLVTLFYKAHKNLQSYSASAALQNLVTALANTSKLTQQSCKHLNFAWPSFYNLQSIKSYLSYILNNQNISVNTKHGTWLDAKHLQFRLGKDKLPTYKQTGSVLGSYIMQAKFGLHCTIYCNTLEQYQQLLPHQALSDHLMQSIQFHLPIPEAITLELICNTNDRISHQFLGQTSTISIKNNALHSLYTYQIDDQTFKYSKQIQ